MIYAEERDYGITQKSTEFVKACLRHLGPIVKIRGFFGGETYDVDGDEQWVSFVDAEGNQIIVSGFSWGYRGEGPHGLLRMAEELGFDIGIDDIAGLSPSKHEAELSSIEEYDGPVSNFRLSDYVFGVGNGAWEFRVKTKEEFIKEF